MGDERWLNQIFGSLGMAIAGGTANIQRNVIAERGLNLPRDNADAIVDNYPVLFWKERVQDTLMHFDLTDDQKLLRDQLDSLLAEHLPDTALMRLYDAPDSFAPGLWSALMAMGLGGVMAPEAAGGPGHGFADLGRHRRQPRQCRGAGAAARQRSGRLGC